MGSSRKMRKSFNCIFQCNGIWQRVDAFHRSVFHWHHCSNLEMDWLHNLSLNQDGRSVFQSNRKRAMWQTILKNWSKHTIPASISKVVSRSTTLQKTLWLHNPQPNEGIGWPIYRNLRPSWEWWASISWIAKRIPTRMGLDCKLNVHFICINEVVHLHTNRRKWVKKMDAVVEALAGQIEGCGLRDGNLYDGGWRVCWRSTRFVSLCVCHTVQCTHWHQKECYERIGGRWIHCVYGLRLVDVTASLSIPNGLDWTVQCGRDNRDELFVLRHGTQFDLCIWWSDGGGIDV